MISREVEMTDHQWMTVHQAANSFCVSAVAAGLRVVRGISELSPRKLATKFRVSFHNIWRRCSANKVPSSLKPMSTVNDFRQAFQF